MKNSKFGRRKKKAVFIDWNGTLSPTKFWSHLEKSKKQSDHDLFKLWSDSMFINHKDKIIPWMRGIYSSEDILALVSKDTKTNFNIILKEFITGCKQMEFSSSDIPDLVKRLRDKSVFVAIATDNMDSFTRWTVPSLSLHKLFEEILNSYDLRALKHDLNARGQSLFFREFFNKYDINPADCILIDDGEDKMNVISDLGIEYRRISTPGTLNQELRNILCDQ